jgi:two-component system LytT family response regulator
MPLALLIDDEVSARADLRLKLQAHPEIAIVGEAATIRTARARLAQDDYDLVFLDVQLIGGEGFDLVPDVREGARIIFVTAHDRYALRAFEINALDYLLKPVARERLATSLGRIGAPLPTESSEADGPPNGPLRHDDTVYLRSGLRARFTQVADIRGIAACDNYSEVMLGDGSKILLRKTLKAWEDALPRTHFMRVHRTRIVNLGHVVRYQRDPDEHTLLFLDGVAAPIAASRDRWPDLRARLSALRPAP